MTHQVCCCNKPANEDTGVCNWPPPPPKEGYSGSQIWVKPVEASFQIPIGLVGNITSITTAFYCDKELGGPQCGGGELRLDECNGCPSQIFPGVPGDDLGWVQGEQNGICNWSLEDGYRDFSYLIGIKVLQEGGFVNCNVSCNCSGDTCANDCANERYNCDCCLSDQGDCGVGGGCLWGTIGFRCGSGGGCSTEGCTLDTDGCCPLLCGKGTAAVRRFNQSTVSGCVPILFRWTGTAGVSGSLSVYGPSGGTCRDFRGGFPGEPIEVDQLCCSTGPDTPEALRGPCHAQENNCPASSLSNIPDVELFCADTLYENGQTTFGFEGITASFFQYPANQTNPIPIAASSGKTLMSIEFEVSDNYDIENLEVVVDGGGGGCVPSEGKVYKAGNANNQVLFDADRLTVRYQYKVKVFYEGFPTPTGINFVPARVYIVAPGGLELANGDFAQVEITPNAGDFGSFFVSTDTADWTEIPPP